MSTNDDQFSVKRKHIRFEPDPKLAAEIDTDDFAKEFHAKFSGLVVEYSPMGGCGLVLLISLGVVKDTTFRIKISNLPPLKAQVIWTRNLDDKVQRCGIKFLE